MFKKPSKTPASSTEESKSSTEAAEKPTHLTAVDLHRMLASTARVAEVRAKCEAVRLAGALEVQSREKEGLHARIALLESQMAQQQSSDKANQRLRSAQNDVKQAIAEQKNLSAAVGAQYGVDWEHAGFEPLTGEIVAMAKPPAPEIL